MKKRVLLCLVLIAIGTGLLYGASRLVKDQIPSETAYTDSTQTFTARQTISGGLSLTGGAPANNGDIGWNSSTSRLEFRHNNTTSELGSGGGSNATQFQGKNITAATPTNTGQMMMFDAPTSAYVLTASITPTNNDFLAFNTASGTWRPSAGGGTFSGDIDTTTNKTLSNLGTTEGGTVHIVDTDGLAISNTGKTTNVTLTTQASDQGQLEASGGLAIVTSNPLLRVGVTGLLTRTMNVTTINSAAQTELAIDGVTNKLTMASNTTHGYIIVVTARGIAGTNFNKSAMYKLEVVGHNNAGASATVGAQLKTIIAEDVSAWDVNAAVEDTGDTMSVSFTGDAASTIKVGAYVQETVVTN